MGTCLATQSDYQDNIQFPAWTEKGPGSSQFKNRDKLMDILKHPYLTILFREFLRLNLALESYLFFVEVEVYRELDDEQERHQLARDIFLRYFGPESEYEINVEGQLIESLKEEIIQPEPTTFDVVQQMILLTLEGTCLPNFFTWKLYLDFLEDPITRKVFFNAVNEYPPCEISNRYLLQIKRKLLSSDIEDPKTKQDHLRIVTHPSSPIILHGAREHLSKSTPIHNSIDIPANQRPRKWSFSNSTQRPASNMNRGNLNDNSKKQSVHNQNFRTEVSETSWKPNFQGAVSGPPLFKGVGDLPHTCSNLQTVTELSTE